ncbi:MAG: YkgJ family cysteine cluster protein [Deltaproteobacteria bacterium]|nr:YkgJ family cysteine cluster protein [Deltaproteobacteria bacterium]
MEGFVCERCGRCCLELDAHQTTVSAEDVARWWAQGREDILEWVEPVMFEGEVLAFDIWTSPRTGDDVSRCPWLRKERGKEAYRCLIHDTKPGFCREYPRDGICLRMKGRATGKGL